MIDGSGAGSGQGPQTAFVLFTPGVAAGSGQAQDTGSERSGGAPGDAGAARPVRALRILIVEDDALIRLDLAAHLLAAGHTVVGAADRTPEALRLVDRERPDLVLMDVRLAGADDGIEAATEIWRRFAVRSLFVSANLDDAARSRAAAANPVGYLEKPFTAHTLLAAVSLVYL